MAPYRTSSTQRIGKQSKSRTKGGSGLHSPPWFESGKKQPNLPWSLYYDTIHQKEVRYVLKLMMPHDASIHPNICSVGRIRT